MPDTAHLLLAEHNALNPCWFPSRDPAGSATLLQQFGEATENLLRRTLKRAQDLRKAHYLLDAAYFVLGRGDDAQLKSRLAIARCLQSVLEPRTGVLHLVGAAHHGQLVPFQLADQLRQTGGLCRLEIHFPDGASPGSPTLSQYTPSRVATDHLLDVA